MLHLCISVAHNDDKSALLCASTTMRLSPAQHTDNALFCSVWFPMKIFWLGRTIVGWPFAEKYTSMFCLAPRHNNVLSCLTHRQCTVPFNVARNKDIGLICLPSIDFKSDVQLGVAHSYRFVENTSILCISLFTTMTYVI